MSSDIMTLSSDDDEDLDDAQSFSLYTNAGKNVKDARKMIRCNLETILQESTQDSKVPVEECKTALLESPPKKAKDSFNLDDSSSPICKIDISDDDDSQDTESLAFRLHKSRVRSTRGIPNYCDNEPNSSDNRPTDSDATPPARGSRGRPVRARGRRGRAAKTNIIDKTPPKYKPFVASNWTLDDSTVLDESLPQDEDDNYEISVKVQWKSDKIIRFPIRKYQKLASIFEHFAKLENVPQSQILLTLNNNIISESDSPDSLNLSIVNIIDGGVTRAVAKTSGSAAARPASPVDVDSIELKVRTKDSKQPTMIRFKKTQKMVVMMTKYSELTEIPLDKLKFSFDGDALDPSETPADLDLEGGEMIDLIVLP